MKNVLNEINRIKNLMLIKEQFEDENNDQVSGTVIIGDNFAELVSDEIQTIPYLVDEGMTVSLMIKKLSSSEVYENVSNLILSIGSVDFFNGVNQVNFLCDLITEVFPNANLYVFKGIISDFDFEDEKEIQEVEETANVFYDEFSICGFEIIGTYPVVSEIPVDFANPAIQDLIEYVGEMGVDDIEIEDTKIEKSLASRSVNDDITDFDSIYEFLEQFEKIYKSKKTYDITLGDRLEFDVKQIQIALNFLIRANLEINGDYDKDTENAVSDFQYKMGLEETGVCDPDTLEEMLYELRVRGFDEEDLAKFMESGKEDGEALLGILDLSRAGLSSEQRKNVEIMIRYMERNGITNPYTQIGILSVIGKESGFIPKNEVGYGNTSDARIESVFGDRGKRCKTFKHDDYKFFDCVYGVTAKSDLGWDTGNNSPGDGYKYIGRGFNQITFKNNYQKYGDAIGMDLVNDPEKLNDVNIAAEAAIAFLTKGSSVPDFESKEDATNYFLDVNAGGFNGRSESRQKAFEWMNKFKVK